MNYELLLGGPDDGMEHISYNFVCMFVLVSYGILSVRLCKARKTCEMIFSANVPSCVWSVCYFVYRASGTHTL